ncbi:protein MpUGT30 [Marchantia polymorpha subsp. ruderalis]|uniref:Glycosyltransferase n=2 Tax=Marchantia polymorpha TaxID=3197 RepID=A0A176VRB5_MARPO|nr:hypothetical protein AXG93_1660s1590 [Marchantia polymorpha subsp. ruderalis]PTQ39337.1 hypothetical protein MARPO_0045s0015 [Marchantia polymorpha]PTQ39338.1 hypothetical protein MARPO_0045s0015 [Marchantia polymorpha]BBN15551.1 hypothetical protein Mp_6g20490 [Marchantia polymorpha subsp. ruderalis]BBN15552.1 hypothetical protein Mp_6g20490 [Marchantia polymorpha subsp. ruderalis]|eukprot:PTQ39337.1 hypothetical protein MARPO_0045s0015 [Marchantia polymorpha]
MDQKHEAGVKHLDDVVPSVWMAPTAYITHALSFLQCAKLLARHGLTITLFYLDDDFHSLDAMENGMLLDNLKREGLDIRMQCLGPRARLVDDGSSDLFRHRQIHHCTAGAERMVQKYMRSEVDRGTKPTCLLSDVWLGSLREEATSYGIPSWVLCPYASGYLSTLTYVYQLQSKGILNLPYSFRDGVNRNECISIPGLPLLKIQDIPIYFSRESPLFEYLSIGAASVSKCSVILLTSFYELESRSIEGFKSFMRALAVGFHKKSPTVWSIGPTFDMASYSKESNVAESEPGELHKHPSIAFLDTQAASSVLLVMFGTLVYHTPEQIEEIARGLENSQQPFLCVLNVPNMNTGWITPGHEEDRISAVVPADCIGNARGRGLFLEGWVPQKKILAHPSTGGFVTHCGQNSILESIGMGIPLIAWPMLSDQLLNARFLVNEVQIAVDISRGPDGFVDRKELEKSVRTLFHSDEGNLVRRNCLMMREMARKAVQENGSSWKNIEALVALIRSLST